MLSLGGRRRCGGYVGGGTVVNCAYVLALIAALFFVVPTAAARPRVLMLGDSITAGLGLMPEQAIPARLEARLKADGVDAEVINAGVSGDTTAGGLARLAWALGDKPQYVLVELGANDMLRGLDPGQAYDNLDKILARLREAGVKTLLIGMRAEANWGKDYQQRFDGIYPRLAAKWHVALYPFILDGVALDPALNQPDGLHPNAKGVGVIVERLAPAVEALLKAARASG